MGSVSIETLRIPVADFGPENPLPLFQSSKELHTGGPLDADSSIPADMGQRLQYGHPVGAYPYSPQDGYSRELIERDVRVAVVENDVLRATFLLDYGGRLWSLVHRATGRNLVYNPGMIRMANLALRNAWFAGGVEWNIGTTGHGPTTCAPLHVAVVERRDGEPVLRLYEYERLRGVIFQVDAWLADGAPFLKVHVRIHNPNTHDVPMYWWSNAAVPEAPDVRVIAPADSAWYFGYDQPLQEVPVPQHSGCDISYPGQALDAADYFFRLPGTQRPWIAALDAEGSGLIQASTAQLRGRKLFRWGTGSGGPTWQRWLGRSDRPYLEIQAGIAETQLEHLRFPAGQSWSWVEAYGMLTADPKRVHGNWTAARRAVEESLDDALPLSQLEGDLAEATAWADAPPTLHLHTGSGWGALEQRRRRLAGEPPLPDEGTPFGPQTLGHDQDPWLELLSTGEMRRGQTPPLHNVLGADWAQRLAEMHAGWLSCYLQGLLAQASADNASSRRHYEASLQYRVNPWALRCLALLDAEDGLVAEASERYLRAHRLAPELLPLTLETVVALLRAERPDDALVLLEELPGLVRSRGRFRMIEAQASAAAGDLERARAIMDDGIVVDDLREGERALDSLWQLLHPGGPVPAHYDFRMRTTDTTA
jgi:hypothetical protein